MAALALVGCGQVPTASLWALRDLDVWSVQPADAVGTLYLPEGVRVGHDAVIVRIRAGRPGSASPYSPADTLDETVILRPQAPGRYNPGRRLAAPWPGGHWWVLTLDDAQAQRLVRLRQRLLLWQRQDPEQRQPRTHAAITPRVCADPGSRWTADAVRLSAWLRWRPQQADVLVFDDLPLAKLLTAQSGATPLPVCRMASR